MARGRGIYRRNKVWWIRYAGPDGRIRFESSRSTSCKKAESMLLQRRKDVEEGKDPIPARRIRHHTFMELAAVYLQWAVRQRSFRSKKVIMGVLTKEFGITPLRRFGTRLVEEYQSRMLTAGKKPATANRHLATLKHAFTKAVEWEMIEEEVLKRVRRVKLLQENNRRLRYLSREESAALINACSPHLRPIVVTALNTGARKEEILSLEWDRHVDLRHNFILLDLTKNGERRELPINLTLREVLSGIVRRIDSPYVFVNDEGKRFGDVKKSFYAACRRAGIKDFRFHDLRHCFASHLVMAGIDITTVKTLLGHKTLTMTLRYSHLAPFHTRNAVAALDQALTGSNCTKTIQSPSQDEKRTQSEPAKSLIFHGGPSQN